MTWTSEQIMQTIQVHMLNECITNARLVELTGLKPEQVGNSTSKLHQNGFIKVVDKGCFRITQAGITALDQKTNLRSGPKGKLQIPRIYRDSLRVRVWRAIRIRSSFSIPDLLPIVTKGGEKDAQSNIYKYIKALESAGYLIRMGKRMPGTAMTSNGFARWRLDLEKNTGPQAPIWRMGKGSVFDPNTEEEIFLMPVKSEDQP